MKKLSPHHQALKDKHHKLSIEVSIKPPHDEERKESSDVSHHPMLAATQDPDKKEELDEMEPAPGQLKSHEEAMMDDIEPHELDQMNSKSRPTLGERAKIAMLKRHGK